jgi:hypothetical protein
LREGWPITAEQRERIVAEAALLALPSPGERTRIAAIRLLVTADSVNARQ